MTTRTRSRIARPALTAAALVLAACAGSDGGVSTDESDITTTAAEDSTPATDPATSASTPTDTAPDSTPETSPQSTAAPATEPATTDAPPDTAADDTAVPSDEQDMEDGGFITDAELLTDQGVFLEENTYRVDSIGTPFSFVVDRPLFVQPNSDGFFVVTDPESVGPDDEDIIMQRATFLSDPATANVGFPFSDASWPVDDIAGWVDNLIDGVDASTPEPTTLGGFPAVGFELEVGDVECGRGPDECVGFASDTQYQTKYFNPGSRYRIWMVEQGAEAPIVVVVATNDDDDAWFETADDVLASVAFDDPQPSPIISVPAGPTELDLLDGIRLDFGLDATLVPGRSYVRLDSQAAAASLLTRPSAADDDEAELESTDDVVAQIQTNGATVSEIEPTTVGGLPARVFEIASPEPTGPVLVFGEQDRRGWFVPSLGTMWVIEHPERGVLVVTAESFLDVPELRDTIRDQITTALSTLTFVEPS